MTNCAGEQPQDQEFWNEFVALLLQLACLIERTKMPDRPTTAELRRAGKQTLTTKNDQLTTKKDR